MQALFEYELEEHIEEYILSRKEDCDDCLFVVTEIDGDVAMLFVDEYERVYINEDAREQLEKEWGKMYRINMNILIPKFADNINAGFISANGVKRVDSI